MGRKLRYLPDDTHLVEITCRVIQRRFLLRPSPLLTAIIIGTLARFQKRYKMRICSLIYLSNHCHLLLRPRSVQQLASFMRDVNSKIAREAGRLHGWREKLWGRRYTDIVTSHEPEAQIARLRYLLEQGCKEGLVASPRHWPGASSIRALMSGEPLEGIWIDRTEQFRAGERGEPNPDVAFTSTHRLELSPLPCWEELTAHQCQATIRSMVREIEDEMEGVEVLGKQAICEQDPHDRPASSPPRTPAPRFHAVAPRVRRALEVAYHLVRIAYHQAVDNYRAGRPGEFPAGCYAPGWFVPLRI
jgi:REP element-mobilizing transposase RayT